MQNIYIQGVLSGIRQGSSEIETPIQSHALPGGVEDPENPTGILDSVQNILGISTGEFDMQWIREFL